MELRSHPAIALAILWMTLAGLARMRGRDAATPRWRDTAVTAAAAGVLFVYTAIVVWYTFEASFYDPAEPTIPAVAWAFRSGQPLYPAPDAPERYAHIYGPLLFIIQAGALSWFGPSIMASKAAGAAAALLSVGIGYRCLETWAGSRAALLASSGSVLAYMCFANATWWTRSDGLLILTVVTGVAAARLSARLPSALLLGVATGCAVSLKLTGPLYLLPAFVLTVSRHGMRAIAPAMLTATAIALMPFLHPRISLAHYVEYFLLSAGNGVELARFRWNVEWAIFLAAPVLAARWPRASGGGRTDAHLLAALLGAIGLVSIAASKPGAGPLHLLPFVPVLAYVIATPPAAASPRGRSPSLALAFALVATLIAVPSQARLIETVAARDLEAAILDIDRFADEHRANRIAVGYAGTSHLSHARVQAVFRMNEYLIDAPAVQEHQLSGLALPAATAGVIDACQVDTWLIPRGAEPFDVPSAYFPRAPRDVFPQSFRSLFRTRYARTGRTAYFDVWTCSRGARSVKALDRSLAWNTSKVLAR